MNMHPTVGALKTESFMNDATPSGSQQNPHGVLFSELGNEGDIADVPSTSNGFSAGSSNDLISVTLPTRSTNANKRKHIRADFDYGKISLTALEAQKRERERLERLEKLRDKVKIIFEDSPSDSVGAEETCGAFTPPSTPPPRIPKVEIDVIELSSDEEADCDVKPLKRSPPSSRISDVGCYKREDETDRLHRLERERLLKKYTSLEKIGALKLISGKSPINTGKPAEDPDVFVAPHLADILQPHQLDGIRFMYDNIIETLHGFSNSSGFGCILAHSMGLGKTIQVITFTEIFLRTTPSKKVLIIVPVNTIQNWYNEFDKWLPSKESEDGVSVRPFSVRLVGDLVRGAEQRLNLIKEWHNEGGVLLMGYDMFRLLVQKKPKRSKPSKKPPCEEVIDLEKEEIDSNALAEIRTALLNPGPDLVVCDEGHRIKNEKTGITVALSAIRTKRRVVLTGYPLQNNLSEYFCMVDFVRPSYLGTKKEFSAMFEKPIKNGLCIDSTASDLKLARQRTHVLIELLKGFVHRRTHNLLKEILPRMTEYVILLRKSPIQRTLYRAFVQYAHSEISGTSLSTFNPLKAFAACSKIYNHPDILMEVLKKTKAEKLQPATDSEKCDKVTKANGSCVEEASLADGSCLQSSTDSGSSSSAPHSGDSDGDSIFGPLPPLISPDDKALAFSQACGSNTGIPPLQYTQYHNPSLPFSAQLSLTESSVNSPAGGSSAPEMDDLGLGEVLDIASNKKGALNRQNTTIAKAIRDEIGIESGVKYEWADVVMHGYESGVMSNGYKISVSFTIIESAASQGEKVLLFSQSLLTLNLLERYLQLSKSKGGMEWRRGVNYFRFDGSTSGSERERLINRFNEDPSVSLFLISTKAGSLGINLVSANRVIIFDASWNPCHDAQAVCRVYRYGQTKPTFVYRLVVDNSMEKAIFNRQIGKNGLQQRVVDDKQMDIDVTKRELEQLLVYDESLDVATERWDVLSWAVEDDILWHTAGELSHMFSQVPILHESLLMERDDGLSAEEKTEALALYQREKLCYKGGDLEENLWRSHSRSRIWPVPGFYPRAHPWTAPMRTTPVPMGLQRASDSMWQMRDPRLAHVGPPMPMSHSFTLPVTTSQLLRLPCLTENGVIRILPPQPLQVIYSPGGGVFIRTADGRIFDASSTVYANLTSARPMNVRPRTPPFLRTTVASDEVICLSDSD